MWRYLRYFRLELPLQFPYHGQQTTRRDVVHLCSESPVGILGWQRTLTGYQSTSAGVPGVYYQRYTNGVPQGETLVQAFGGQAQTGTLVWDVTADIATGGSRIVVSWNGTLLEDTVSATNLSQRDGASTYDHPACYVLSDPMYVSGYTGYRVPVWSFAETVRVGPLGGCVYGEPDADGVCGRSGARSWNFADWWAAMGYAVPELAGMASAWNATRRGVWAGYVYPGHFLKVDAGGALWGDGVTAVRDTPAMNDYLQVYLFGESPGGSSISAVTDRTYRTKVASVNAAATAVTCRRVERVDVPATWGAPVTVAVGEGLSHPSLAAYEDGVTTCWYMVGGTQHASISTDDGRTWQELTGMMGSTLRNVAVTQHHGITLGVGVRGGNLYFVRSNDQGRTQDGIPGGSAMQLVGPCASDCRPAITWYPDGEVAVWAEDASGNEITYVNSSSGYGAWAVVS